MAWNGRTVEELREEFVKRVLANEKSKSALCQEYGISRPTGDKWIQRYLNNESLSDKSRAPFTTPNRIPDEIEQLIVDTRKQYPALGAAKIHRILINQGHVNLPCVKTINNVLKRNHLISKEASLNATPHKRFEKSAPNDMWQADYKGHFALKDNTRCHPLNIIDDYSRFNLCCEAQYTESFAEIKPVMLRLFNEFGLPFSVLCDNGNPWGTPQSTGYTKFEVWLMELGILTIHCRFRHPQTQGKEESFNRSFSRECLAYHSFENMNDAQKGFDEYRNFYNTQRPHHALDLDVPAQKYVPSERKMPEQILDWQYPQGYQLCKVKDTGFFNYGNQGYFLSESFAGKIIAVRESSLPGQISLFFRQFRIGRIDVENRVYTSKRAYLIEGDPRL